ncbi:hypothetical protein BDZ85DRAFT_247865 [Elsinoe ampelina]|uniref:Uncharacterized protein n=1 Tax=Elsinoe ampelina TaxID=302913 RepID=A0A6A6GJL5_9PEZI|nr:hypothetical protein BDZ85DRAFT_247865 [Elsinoe ampelina]
MAPKKADTKVPPKPSVKSTAKPHQAKVSKPVTESSPSTVARRKQRTHDASSASSIPASSTVATTARAPPTAPVANPSAIAGQPREDVGRIFHFDRQTRGQQRKYEASQSKTQAPPLPQSHPQPQPQMVPTTQRQTSPHHPLLPVQSRPPIDNASHGPLQNGPSRSRQATKRPVASNSGPYPDSQRLHPSDHQPVRNSIDTASPAAPSDQNPVLGSGSPQLSDSGEITSGGYDTFNYMWVKYIKNPPQELPPSSDMYVDMKDILLYMHNQFRAHLIGIDASDDSENKNTNNLYRLIGPRARDNPKVDKDLLAARSAGFIRGVAKEMRKNMDEYEAIADALMNGSVPGADDVVGSVEFDHDAHDSDGAGSAAHAAGTAQAVAPPNLPERSQGDARSSGEQQQGGATQPSEDTGPTGIVGTPGRQESDHEKNGDRDDDDEIKKNGRASPDGRPAEKRPFDDSDSDHDEAPAAASAGRQVDPSDSHEQRASSPRGDRQNEEGAENQQEGATGTNDDNGWTDIDDVPDLQDSSRPSQKPSTEHDEEIARQLQADLEKSSSKKLTDKSIPRLASPLHTPPPHTLPSPKQDSPKDVQGTKRVRPSGEEVGAAQPPVKRRDLGWSKMFDSAGRLRRLEG